MHACVRACVRACVAQCVAQCVATVLRCAPPPYIPPYTPPLPQAMAKFSNTRGDGGDTLLSKKKLKPVCLACNRAFDNGLPQGQVRSPPPPPPLQCSIAIIRCCDKVGYKER
jgi:hypothetical protein